MERESSLDHEWEIYLSSKYYELDGYVHNSDFVTYTCTNFVLHILQEVGAERKVPDHTSTGSWALK